MNNSISIAWRKAVLALAIVLCALLQPAYSEINDPVLLLQQSPANGGIINPDVGVHYLKTGTSVTLTAVPRAGYQFVYWLGDVSDPTSSHTTLYLDSPKIVIAVFERTEYELKIEVARGIPGGVWGRTRPSASDYSRRGGGGGGGDEPRKPKPPPKPPKPPKHDPEIPVPVPEPATLVLLAVGGFLAFARRRPGK